MRKHAFGLMIAALFPVVALAQNNRSAVSVNGNDLNPCTPASPCRSFGAAMTHTNFGGEIIALDSAGYGPFAIDRQITVSGAPGVHAALTVSSGTGISVSIPSGYDVAIRNLVLIGAGGAIGIDIESGGQTRVLGCLVRGFSTEGINCNSGNLSVDHSAIIDNLAATGIRMANASMTGSAHAAIGDSVIQGNLTGVYIDQFTDAVVRNSTLTGNGTGASAVSTTGMGMALASLTLENCAIAHNSATGVFASASGGMNFATIYMSQNVIAYNPVGVQNVNQGIVYSFANNRFVGNGSDGGPFTAAPMK